MRETGKIVRMEGDQVIVEVDTQSGCDKCGMGDFCQGTKAGKRELRVPMPGSEFKPGDRVEVETPARNVLVSGFIVFLLPLLVSLAAYGITERLGGPGMLAFFIALALAEGIVFCIDRWISRRRMLQPRIVGKEAKR